MLAFGLAACVPSATDEGQDPQTYGSDVGLVDEASERAACEAKGGTYNRGGIAGGFLCFTTPEDAGKRCNDGGDCSTGMCLARSKSCAPIEPLFGCNDILYNGNPVTLCVD